MIGQSYEDSSFWQSMQSENNATSTPQTKRSQQPGPLGFKIQQLLGDDTQPDPLFFEESWTLGLAAAVRNQRQRRQLQAARRPLNYNVATSYFMQQQEWNERQTKTEAQAKAAAAQTATVREEDFARVEEQEARQWRRFAEARASLSTASGPMTRQLACKLLGVSLYSSHEEIRSAYRSLVSQWHPDRLASSSEETRRLATDQMAAINQAYSLLRNVQHQRAA